MAFESVASYRAVILTLYSPMHHHYGSIEPSEYTDSQGNVHRYHAAEAYGPYTKRGQAKSILKQELWWLATHSPHHAYHMKHVDSVVAFTESSFIDWGHTEEHPLTAKP